MCQKGPQKDVKAQFNAMQYNIVMKISLQKVKVHADGMHYRVVSGHHL